MNVFAGARRLALLFGALLVVVVLLVRYEARNEYLPLVEHAAQDRRPRLADECPAFKYETLDASVRLTDGETQKVTHCFADLRIGSERRIAIPSGDTYVTFSAYEDAAKTAMKHYADDLVLSAPLANEVSSEARKKLALWLGSMAGYPAASAIGWWVAVAILGWIVRGFMGIPNGKDHKPTTPPAP